MSETRSSKRRTDDRTWNHTACGNRLALSIDPAAESPHRFECLVGTAHADCYVRGDLHDTGVSQLVLGPAESPASF